MPQLRACLWFNQNQARAAAEFYAATFPDSHIGAANDLTVEFTILGEPFIGLNGGPAFRPNESVSFQIITADQPETNRYWNAIISSGGQESACGWCKDRWGFSWQIIPKTLLEALADPDPEAAKRAMDAMMTMRRIDIAQIEAARVPPP